jgi:hypothetical protein
MDTNYILNELEFAITTDVSNPDMYKGWSCKFTPLNSISEIYPVK